MATLTCLCHEKKCLLLLFMTLFAMFAREPGSVIPNADTGNEVDDLHAIIRALIEPPLDVFALNATQWQSSRRAADRTMEERHRLNQVLLAGHLL